MDENEKNAIQKALKELYVEQIINSERCMHAIRGKELRDSGNWRFTFDQRNSNVEELQSLVTYLINELAKEKIAIWNFHNLKESDEKKLSSLKEMRDAKQCPKCGEYEYRLTPDIGWYCSNCHHKG